MGLSGFQHRQIGFCYNFGVTSSILLSVVILTNLSDVASVLASGQVGARFRIEGKVMDQSQPQYGLTALSDGPLRVILRDVTPERKGNSLKRGNVIRASGLLGRNEFDFPCANCTDFRLLEESSPPHVVDTTPRELLSNAPGQLVRLRGTVRTAFRDEIDPKYVWLVLTDGGATTHAAFCVSPDRLPVTDKLVNCEVALVGVYANPTSGGLRRLFGNTVTAFSPEALTILRPAPQDPFDVPEIETQGSTSPANVMKMGRRKIAGTVVAVLRNAEILVRDSDGGPHRVRLMDKSLPDFGTAIEAVGAAETDLYRINLSEAVWRPAPFPPIPPEPPADVPVFKILGDGRGNPKIDPTYHGKAIRLHGTVIDLPNPSTSFGTLVLKCGEHAFPVDISANKEQVLAALTIGCKASIAGTCVIETESWRPNAIFPHATGMTLVVRTPEDIHVVERPPWWTPMRFLAVVSVLLAALVAFFIWNRWLNRLVVRRSRTLLKEQIALTEAELKIGERTRLAIELHDSLSQNLAAVACQIAATESAVAVGRDEAIANIKAAERMLLSCRTELRRCLWDLRNDTLEERSMTEVVRKVLKPVIGSAELRIRFNVPRQPLDDTIVHAIISIVRELVSNAVRHGRATRIAVAGDVTDGTLAFSVRDNGIGFDPNACAGPDEGHFGLQGVRERAERLCGALVLRSSPGAGCYAKVTFKLSEKDLEDRE